METAGLQKQQTNQTRSVAGPLWDPFWFMREMFGWGRSAATSSVDVKETDDTYVCKVKLTLPDQADVAHVKAELHDGELTLVVPKAAAANPEPAPPPPTTRRAKGNGRRSANTTARRGARTPARRG
jgi:HSP20 family molecular chaperone IbpA